MGKQILVATILTAITALVITASCLYVNRYFFVNAGDGYVYMLDKFTGDLSLYHRHRHLEIVVPPELDGSLTSDSERAIELAKNSYTYSGTQKNENTILDYLKDLNGDLKIHGWKAHRHSSGSFLVSFGFDHNGETRTYNVEVILEGEIVRPIHNDAVLREKYDFPEIKPDEPE